MKYEKPVVRIIDVKEDIVTSSAESTCPHAIHRVTDRCTGQSYNGYQKCNGSMFVNS